MATRLNEIDEAALAPTAPLVVPGLDRPFLPLAPGSDAEQRLVSDLPRGVIVGGEAAASRNREHKFYAVTKNLGALGGLVWALSMPTGWVEWTGFALFYVMNILSMSLGYHRYFTHRAFETSTPMRYALAILAQLGIYGSLMRWCADHRRHHALPDRPGDVHSPYFTGTGEKLSGMKGWRHAHLGWAFSGETSDYGVYGKGIVDDPAIRFAHDTRLLWYGVSVLVLPALWATGFARVADIALTWQLVVGSILIAGFLRANIALHAIASVNSFGHIYGYQRFKGQDSAKNNWFLGLITLGEGWHNNHHAYANTASNQFAWYEIDLTGWLIHGMEKVGLVWNVKPIPHSARERLSRGAKA